VIKEKKALIPNIEQKTQKISNIEHFVRFYIPQIANYGV